MKNDILCVGGQQELFSLFLSEVQIFSGSYAAKTFKYVNSGHSEVLYVYVNVFIRIDMFLRCHFTDM
jgi:hypothetical protein